jgi:hypothetical protein
LTVVNDPIANANHSESVVREPRRLRRERQTVRAMVALYCRHHHGGRGLCEVCAGLLEYADRHLDRCPYGSDKPTCANCPIHCYRPEPRERMRDMMRFAGPRMLTRHPCLAILHLIDGRRPAPPLPRRAGTEAAVERDSGGCQGEVGRR